MALSTLLLLLLTLAAPPEKIAVYVTLPERDGFVDAGEAMTDSKDDLQREIGKRENLRAVARRDDADIVLTVVDRGFTTEEGGGMVFIPIGNAVVARPTRRSWNTVRARMDAGEYSTLLTGRFSGIGDVWEECAEIVSKELEGWAVANRDRLIARRVPKARR
jgi:hypothetical protein